MYAKKSLGQNFLMHARTAERIADAAELAKGGTVLEIGPGTGMLTKPLLARAKRVIAIEADAELASALRDTFAVEIKNNSLELIRGDVRAFDPSSISGEYALVANIPYYLTGEIIRSFLEAAHKPRSMTLLVQKEVAERIARSKKESLLSIAVKAFGTPRYRFTVPRGAFKPAPNVDSAVITIADINQRAFASAAEEKRFFAIARAGFAHKRKLLARNLEAVAEREAILAALAGAEASERVRPEELSTAQWRQIAAALPDAAAS